MDINFELYKVFYYVSKKMSFSGAANKLFISQSAVSQSIKLLEEKLNCTLFFRNTKKVKLTREGELLFQHIEQAFNFIKSGERAIEDMHSLTQGDIRIAASDTICKYYLMPYFKKFNEMYPNIKIHVTNRTSPKCIDLLKNGSVDFSVINIPEKNNFSTMNVIRTRAVRDVFIANRNYSELYDRQVSLKELESYPILVLEKNTITRDFFDDLMFKNDVNIKPEVESGSVDLLIDMAKIGLGIAFVPDECIRSEYAENEISEKTLFIIDLKEKISERFMGIVTHKNLPLPIAAAKFIQLLEVI